MQIRIAAYAAGLGEIGWSKVFLTKEYGPRQRFGMIITDASLEPEPLVPPGTICDKCMQCVAACPSDAIPHINEGKVVEIAILGPGVPHAGKFPFFLKAGYKAYPLPKKREAVERMLESEKFFVPYGYGEHHGLPTIRLALCIVHTGAEGLSKMPWAI